MANKEDVKKAYTSQLVTQGRAYSLDHRDEDLNFIKDWLRENSGMSFKEKLIKDKVFNYPTITEEEATCWADKIDFEALAMSMDIKKFSSDFFESFRGELNWSLISANKTMSLNFAKEFIDSLVPAYILNNMSINLGDEEDFMRELIERQRAIIDNNSYLLSEPELSSSLKSFFKTISFSRVISEQFMKDYSNELDWTSLSLKQSMSLDFLIEFADKITWDNIIRNIKVSEESKYRCLMDHDVSITPKEWSRWKIMKDNYEIRNGLLDGKKME